MNRTTIRRTIAGIAGGLVLAAGTAIPADAATATRCDKLHHPWKASGKVSVCIHLKLDGDRDITRIGVTGDMQRPYFEKVYNLRLTNSHGHTYRVKAIVNGGTRKVHLYGARGWTVRARADLRSVAGSGLGVRDQNGYWLFR